MMIRPCIHVSLFYFRSLACTYLAMIVSVTSLIIVLLLAVSALRTHFLLMTGVNTKRPFLRCSLPFNKKKPSSRALTSIQQNSGQLRSIPIDRNMYEAKEVIWQPQTHKLLIHSTKVDKTYIAQVHDVVSSC